jgi:hypothetical protein
MNLELTRADVDEVLARLPALRRLDLGMTRLPAAVAAHLAAAAPQLGQVLTQPLPREYQYDFAVEEHTRTQERRWRSIERRAALSGDPEHYIYTEEDAIDDLIYGGI